MASLPSYLYHIVHCTRLNIVSTHTSWEAAQIALRNLPLNGRAWHNIIDQEVRA